MIETILHVLAAWAGMAIGVWLWIFLTGHSRKSIGSDFKPTKKRSNSPPPDTKGTKNE
jgi:hypothetical protein